MLFMTMTVSRIVSRSITNRWLRKRSGPGSRIVANPDFTKVYEDGWAASAGGFLGQAAEGSVRGDVRPADVQESGNIRSPEIRGWPVRHPPDDHGWERRAEFEHLLKVPRNLNSKPVGHRELPLSVEQST